MEDNAIVQVPAVYHRRLGEGLVTAVADGYVDMPYTIFHGIAEDEVKAILAREQRISPPRLSVNAFVLRMAGKTYLFDCGSQHFMGPTCGRLPENLAHAGIAPETVDGVILTHIHPDHSNGLTDVSTGRMLFPNAEIFVPEAEFSHCYDDEAMAKADERPRLRYFKWGRDQLDPYVRANRIRTVGEGEFLPGITAVPCPGHTPGHTSYVVSSGSEAMMVWGDTVHVPEIQLARPEVALQFDFYPDLGVQSRKKIFDMVLANNLLVAGMHVHFPGFARMREENGRLELTAEQWAFTF